jgi:hypothetical protein
VYLIELQKTYLSPKRITTMKIKIGKTRYINELKFIEMIHVGGVKQVSKSSD